MIEFVNWSLTGVGVRLKLHNIEKTAKCFSFSPEFWVIFKRDYKLKQFNFGQSSHFEFCDRVKY